MKPTPFAIALKAAMKQARVSGEALAERAETHPVTVSKLLNGRMQMTEEWMTRFARALGMSVTDIMTGDGMDGGNALGREPQSRRTVPVFGLAAGAITGAHTRSNDPVEFIPCPPGLASVRDAYALIVIGTSMEPRYFAGEVIYIHPHRPVRAGDHVVIQEERDGGIQVSVKLFERTTDEHVVTRQYNPASTVKFLRSRIVAVHRVMTSNELMGI